MLKTTLLLCRHAEGQHLTGAKFDLKYGPSLTEVGSGQAYRRVVRQLKEMNFVPDRILVSPQLRAIQTAAFSRKNRRILSDGKTILKDVPIEILPTAYEQTRLLGGQGNIIPLFNEEQKAKNWKNERLMKNDKPLWQAIEDAFPLEQPKPDQNGSSTSRSEQILAHLEKKYPNKVILLICHDGIARDIISRHTGQKVENIFDLVEIRNLNCFNGKKRPVVPKKTTKKTSKKKTPTKKSPKKTSKKTTPKKKATKMTTSGAKT